MKNTFKK